MCLTFCVLSKYYRVCVMHCIHIHIISQTTIDIVQYVLYSTDIPPKETSVFYNFFLPVLAFAFLLTIMAMAMASIALIRFVEQDKAHYPALTERWWYKPLTLLGYIACLLVGMSTTTYMASEWSVFLPLWALLLPVFIYSCWRNAGLMMNQMKRVEAFCTRIAQAAAERLYGRVSADNHTETRLRRVK